MTHWIPEYQTEDFSFCGAWCFDDINAHLLLGSNGCVILLDDLLLEEIESQSPSDSLCLKLVQHGLANVDGSVTVAQSCDIIKPSYFLIDITKCCNFKCVYCFRDLNDRTTINQDTLTDICNYICNYINENDVGKCSIQLWGGEPIIAMERIRYIVNFFSEKSIDVKFDIETNASLVTDDVASQLKDWNISVGVSIDGLPEHQNAQRKLVTDLDSSQPVITGIKNLQKYYGNQLGGITVITKNNYRDITKIIDYYVNELNIISMKFNIIRESTNTKDAQIGLSTDEVAEFAENLYVATEAYNLLGIPFSENNIFQRKENLLSRSHGNFCMSCGCRGGYGIISFSMNGYIYPCEMVDIKEERIGSIYDSASLVEQISRAVRDKPFFNKKKDTLCASCPWHYYCRGGCTSRMYYKGKSSQIDEVECVLNRTIYPKLVNSILKRAKTKSGMIK